MHNGTSITSKNNGESLIINLFYSKFQSCDQQCLINLLIDFASVAIMMNTVTGSRLEATGIHF